MDKTVNNYELLNKLEELDYEPLYGREHSIKNLIQASVLIDAFDVKHDEIVNKENYVDYDRNQVQSDINIIKDFKDHIRLYHELPKIRNDQLLYIKYFIEIVQYFNKSLANDLYQVAKSEHIEGY